MKIFFDGGCRPNPGRIELAVVARGVAYVDRDAGYGSSHDAEWLALLRAVAHFRALGVRDAVLLGDSAAIVAQANAALAGRAAPGHASDFAAAVAGLRLRVRHIKRTQNLAGIALARLHR
ncbi:reverse transcriptase-like protein [Sphingomonas sp. GC_Shp_3]|uniref:ribonuclease HI n=1 Tax=Sphingomonas sp. GC_Shp_3 TaxID=2937383 RepID=UPI00226A47A5|nr:reverse transcriptase-like protein [Sphingomonas sp. GC_Shp_3]